MPVTSRAAVLVEPNKPLVVDEVTFPDPEPDQVLVKLFASGICHSQLHQIFRPAQAWAPGRLPTLLGHESTGVVVAKGRDVNHVKEGDHVITTWIDKNNSERKLPPVSHALNQRPPILATWRGNSIVASAATWAEHVIASDRVVLPMEDDVPTDVTSIIGCAVPTAVGAIINTLQVRAGQSIAIIGAGGIGLCAIAAAAAVAAYPIIAVDTTEEKLSFARRFGATHGINASKEDPVQRILTISGEGVDFAIDAVGLPATQEQILKVVRAGAPGLGRGGTALLVGLPPPNEKVMLNTSLFAGGRTFTRTHAGDCRPDRDFPIFVRWYREGKLRLNDLVTKRYSLDQVNEAVSDLSEGRVMGRGIFVYS
ncbi:MAG: zinc-binding dehydrogenase [Deltaproteobacteria bacterium]|nr:zinc-binding dehydrogenase [Deltaproteobacteria bacterium]